jgi:hypothetical protein
MPAASPHLANVPFHVPLLTVGPDDANRRPCVLFIDGPRGITLIRDVEEGICDRRTDARSALRGIKEDVMTTLMRFDRIIVEMMTQAC